MLFTPECIVQLVGRFSKDFKLENMRDMRSVGYLRSLGKFFRRFFLPFIILADRKLPLQNGCQPTLAQLKDEVPYSNCGGKRMFTSVTLVALSGLLPLTTSKEPVWLQDYASARSQCEKVGRPLALFVGSGPEGWKHLSQDGQLSSETTQILAAKYVCLYVDANKKAGRELAVTLEMPRHLGLVISDSTGHLQAFRHEGDLRTQDLQRYLYRYSDPERLVTTTESNPGEEPPVRIYRSERSVAPASYSSFSVGRSC